MNEILRLSDLSKTYKQGEPGEVTVLSKASFTLNTGEVVGLVAPSGAGKSTLLHIAGLLDLPDSGTVAVGGQDLTGKPDRQRTRIRRQDIGFVYQFHHLLAEFSALENITLPQFANGIPSAEAEQKARDLLASVGLTERSNHRPAELSGGEQQRVAFCRAMANSPRILLADEPTGNLDPATSDTVFEALMSLVRNTGLSALIATHNMALAQRMDRIVRLENGKLVDV